MPLSQSELSRRNLRRVFTEGFTARDIAEPLVSFDANSPSREIALILQEIEYDVAGIRQGGFIHGFVHKDDLGEGPCGQFMQPIPKENLLLDSSDFSQVIQILNHSQQIFVEAFGRIGGIITKSDLQKPPVRMWLFGMVTIIEMGFVALVQRHFSSDEWRSCLSAGRIQQAEKLLEERKRRGQYLGLMECLQFSDKGQIIVKTPELLKKVGFPSRRRGEEVIKDLEKLRNNLAHSQDIMTYDWEVIVGLSAGLDRVLALLQE